ncbi:MAG: gamma-glutamylcyclotransferase [Gammaproteobacteria bacterium]|nr:gamma-glutamylcyclotransferase [Gammaproteobacteria bacterium]
MSRRCSDLPGPPELSNAWCENPTASSDTRRARGTTALNVFFYGLFMDTDLLAAHGIRPVATRSGVVEGYTLRIGARATLVRHTESQVHGVLMELGTAELSALYAAESVADYVPEPVSVQLRDGSEVDATCYNLPPDKIAGSNPHYAARLLQLARQLGFPASYLEQIRQAQS